MPEQQGFSTSAPLLAPAQHLPPPPLCCFSLMRGRADVGAPQPPLHPTLGGFPHVSQPSSDELGSSTTFMNHPPPACCVVAHLSPCFSRGLPPPAGHWLCHFHTQPSLNTHRQPCGFPQPRREADRPSITWPY